MGKKIAAIALAVLYFSAAHCRLACALSASPPAAVDMGRDDGSCHHGDKSKSPSDSRRENPAPCCAGHFDDAPALLPGDVAAAGARLLVSDIDGPSAAAAVGLVQLSAFRENHDPPFFKSEALERSPQSPRAPPSSLAVL